MPTGTSSEMNKDHPTSVLHQDQRSPEAVRFILGFLFTIIITVLVLPRSASCQSVEVQHLFDQANEHYKSGQYEQAIEAYEKVLSLGFESVELYYDLGNAYYRTNQIGKAILNLERARRLAPKDEDVLHNLQIVGLRVVDKVPEPPRMFFQVWFQVLRDSLSLDEWTVLVLVLYLLIGLLLVVRILGRATVLRRWARRFLVVSVIFLVLCGTIWAGSFRAERQVYAVVLKDRVDVRSAPEKGATEVFPLHEGIRVQIRKKVGEWCEIRLPDGKVGWLPADVLEAI